MKTFNPLLFITLLCLFFSCSDDEDKITEEMLPYEIQSFINSYLPNNPVVNIEDLHPSGINPYKYQITFNGNLTVIFGTNGEWLRATSEDQLPESLLYAIGSDELSNLKRMYPDLPVTGIFNDEKSFRRRIKLKDDKNLLVYYESNQVVIGTDLIGHPDQIPSKIKDFIKTYYGNYVTITVLKANEPNKGDIYNVVLVVAQTRTSLKEPADVYFINVKFDRDGNWYKLIGPKEFPIPNALNQTLPANVKKYMETYHPDIRIYDIEKFDSYYLVRIDDNLSAQITSTDEEVFRMDELQLFYGKYFNDNISNINVTHQLDSKVYCSTVTGKKYTVYIESDAVINWTLMESKSDLCLPVTVLDTLPAAIKDKLHSLSKDELVKKIVKETDGSYSILVNNEILKFSAQGKIIEE